MALDVTHPKLPRSEDFCAAFAAVGAAQPIVLWNPVRADLQHPMQRRFLDLCTRASDPSGRLSQDAYKALDLTGMAPNLLLINRSDHPGTFVYEEIGPEFRATGSIEIPGQNTAHLPPNLRLFCETVLAAVFQTGKPVLCVHEPRPDVFATSRNALLFPLHDANGHVTRVACVVVNENELRPGLDALPDFAFVLRPDGRLVYANAVAQGVFGDQPFQTMTMTLADYCGIEIDLDYIGSLGCNATGQLVRTIIGDRILMHFRLTARKIQFRNAPLYVVVARPE